MGIAAIFGFIKSIPGMILSAVLVGLLGVLTYYMIHASRLETSLAQTQAAAAVLKQSNTSLELDNQKKQKEFEAALAEQKAITTNDSALREQARKSADEAKALGDKIEGVRKTDPVEFLRQINREIGCDFQGFGNPSTCDTLAPSK